MKSVDVSVIVPVYNVEKYFSRCIDSLKKQNDVNLEFILVDDGSPDNSPEMCEDVALEDERFCVVHKTNGGLSQTRNVGISISEGRFLSFVDSDDFLINQPFKYALNIIKTTNVDIVAMNKYDGNGVENFDSNNNAELFTNNYSSIDVFNMLCKASFPESAWNKLYKRDLFSMQYFDEGILNEDFLFFIKLLHNDLKITYSNYVGYYYVLHEGSITSSGFKKNMIDALYNAHYAYENIPHIECKKSATGYFLFKILMFMINMPSDFISKKNSDYLFANKNLKELKNEINKTTLSTRNKLLLNMFCKHPKFTKSIVDKYMKGRE